MRIVTLITDFGTSDPYSGALKGVVLGTAPGACVVDITHEIEPHSIMHAAFVLRHIWSWYPPGTIHLAVVDPGVGSARRIIAGRYDGRYVVAPDNGLITLVHREVQVEAVHVVENVRFYPSDPSPTFHGRDIMAPVAGHLANGVGLGDLGPAAEGLEMLAGASGAEATGGSIIGRVLHVDRFGTLVTNIRREQLQNVGEGRGICEVHVNGQSVGAIRATFSDVGAGEPVALIGGFGLLEIAINSGRAVERFGPVESVRVECR